MKPISFKNALAALAALALALAAPRAQAAADPYANAATQQTLAYVSSLHWSGLTLSMQHVGNPWRCDDLQANPPNEKKSEITRTFELTGRYPAIIALDFLNCDKFAERKTSILNLANVWKNRGGLVSFQFHEGSPRAWRPEDTSFYSAVLSSGEWNSLLNDTNSNLYKNWRNHMDLLAGWMQTLQSNGVTILWRPYHEAHGTWFWWGGNSTNLKRLWQMQFNYLTYTKGIHNLLWVTSANDPAYYPGDGYVDVNGFDYYTNNASDGQFISIFGSIRAQNYGEPAALTETGVLPTNSIIQQNDYAWVGIWSGGFLDPGYYGSPGNPGGNTNAQVQSFYWDKHTVCLSPGVWNGVYKIVNRNSGQALNTESSNFDVNQRPYSGSWNQRWAVAFVGDGQYFLANLATNRVLDVTGSGGSGADVTAYTNNLATNQRWTLTYTDSNYYRFDPSYNYNIALDVSGASTVSGANVQVWNWGGGANQQWQFQGP